MAKVEGLFENIKGVLGDIGVVHMGKIVYLRKRPSKSKKPLSKLALAKRASFGLAGKIGGTISSIEEIKHFWDPLRTGNQSSYNRIFMANHQKTEIEKLKWDITLSPEDAFEALYPLITIGESGFFIEWKLTNNNDMKKPEEVKFMMSAGVVILKNPTIESYPDYLIMTFKTKKIPIENSGRFSAEIIYEELDRFKFLGYTTKNIFGVFITIDGNGNPLEISKTFTNKI